MKYQVQQNGVPADCHNFQLDPSWDNATFDTLEEAESYFENYFGRYVSSKSITLNKPFEFERGSFAAIIEISE